MAKDWVFTYEGTDYWVDGFSIAEAEEVEEALRDPDNPGTERWIHWSPIGLARHCRVLSAVFLRRTKSAEEVEGILTSTPFAALRGMWDLREEDLPTVYEDGVPNLEASPSTPTS